MSKEKTTVEQILTTKYPQLMGEVELLKSRSADWDIILSADFSQSVEEDINSLKELMYALGFDEKNIEEDIDILISHSKPNLSPKNITTNASDIKIEKPSWRIKNVLESKSIHLLAGEPKTGKSFLTTYIGACISSGKPCFGEPQDRGKVLYFAGEDTAGYVVDRLVTQGADLNNIQILEQGQDIVLPNDFKKLAFEIATFKPKVVVIDTINHFLNGKTDTNNDKSLRLALKPLVLLAQYYSCSIIMVSHLNKGQSTNPNHRINGSIGYYGLARLVWFFGVKPDSNERLLTVTANSYGKMSSYSFNFYQEQEDNTPEVIFNGETDEKAYEIELSAEEHTEEIKDIADDILDFIKTNGSPLKDGGLRVSSVELTKYLDTNNYKFNKAKKLLGDKVQALQIGGAWQYVANSEILEF